MSRKIEVELVKEILQDGRIKKMTTRWVMYEPIKKKKSSEF